MRNLLRFFLAITLAVFFTVTVAGGVEETPPASPPVRNGVYIDIAAGYGAVDWCNFGIGPFSGYNTFGGQVTSNPHGAFTFGFDVGYQINNISGIEVGWYYLPEVKGNSNINAALPNLKLESWLAYLALKMIVPFNHRFSIFGKAGLGYRSLDWSGSAANVFGFGDHDIDYLSGVFGAGFQYYFNDNLSISAQYLYMLGKTSGNQISHRAPSANLIVGTIAYIFPVV